METISQPVRERVTPVPGTSFLVKHYAEPKKRVNKLPKWHYHPELELVYVRGGHGRRHVGSHISHYQDGELILIGSNLPHLGFTDRMSNNEKETVVQFAPSFPNYEFLDLPEMRRVKELMHRARNGISFHGTTRMVQGGRLERLIDLPPLGRLLLLVDILNELANSTEYESLNAEGFHLEIETHGYDRFNQLQEFIGANFDRDISLDEVAGVAAMTVPAFCRYFKKTTGKTFVTFLNDFRIVYSCKLLADDHSTVQNVAFDSGFNTVSQFNRAFKKHTGMTATEYRAKFRLNVSGQLPGYE
ncbi:AraC-like DNA-binding protein/quercetin dioxygenase-like cupin family protein [Lewinella marina]|uniref:AraC family transcriptional regulator n=1 Tax=Neolewinella marina TaxID=438751 RepID=A0A2G0CG50_9BACT|nr:AraC family transcriptional regulator [Neolewinella marina]NJB85839.1 AraC-like DNA-binding protein/quercetin dioxygenase-like cupin family protein [Neolewinella marina]PHK98900.1 AraC family transcriptional regulator [Neolewinella marina]